MNTYRVEIWNPNFKRPFGLQSPPCFSIKIQRWSTQELEEQSWFSKITEDAVRFRLAGEIHELRDEYLFKSTAQHPGLCPQHKEYVTVLSNHRVEKKKNPCSRNRISKCITISCTTCFPLPSRGLSYTVWYCYVMDTSPKSFFQMFR